jgi:hypothetical protein
MYQWTVYCVVQWCTNIESSREDESLGDPCHILLCIGIAEHQQQSYVSRALVKAASLDAYDI